MMPRGGRARRKRERPSQNEPARDARTGRRAALLLACSGCRPVSCATACLQPIPAVEPPRRLPIADAACTGTAPAAAGDARPQTPSRPGQQARCPRLRCCVQHTAPSVSRGCPALAGTCARKLARLPPTTCHDGERQAGRRCSRPTFAQRGVRSRRTRSPLHMGPEDGTVILVEAVHHAEVDSRPFLPSRRGQMRTALSKHAAASQLLSDEKVTALASCGILTG